MLESLVSTLLNRVLGAYVSNLNYNQLQIGIWSGEVVLRDLKLKREALDKLNLPVDVLEGYLGELTLNIPWSNLKGKPVMIYIKDVYVLAVPRNESTMSAEEIDARQQEAKKRKLANAELIQPSRPIDATEDAKNETFVNQMMTKILNNLQFSITNIHVRFEDDVSTPGTRFAVGVTLNELSAISTDENWIPQTIGDAVNTVHKLATLESLSVYWNTDTRSLAKLGEGERGETFKKLIATKSRVPTEHQYVLKPVSGTGKIKLNKKFGDTVPKVDAALLFDELAFVMDDEQYRDAILLIDLFHSYLKKQKYQHLHPENDMTPRTHPREFFQFAANAVLSEIHTRNHQWTWEHFKERRDERVAYLDCYVADKLGRSTQEQQEKLESLECKLSYEDIRLYRSMAKSRLKRKKAILAAEEERKRKEEESNSAVQARQGWLSSWIFGSTNPDQKEGDTADGSGGGATNDQNLVITEEQKQEFYDAIEYDEDTAAIEASVDFPRETIFFSLKTTLNRGSFALKSHPHSDTPIDLVSLVFDTVILGATQYVDSFKATAALGDLRLYDGVTKDTCYRQLIGAKQKGSGDAEPRSTSDNETDFPASGNRLFSMVFEHKPLDDRADNALALTMRNIDIVYNPVIIREILSFFRPPETSADSVNALIEAAGDTFEDFKNQTRSNLEFALEHHTTLDLRVDMDAPVIVIPEDCTSAESRCIVLDAGHINVESNPAPPEATEQMRTKRNADYTSEDFVRLRSLMYDKFTVRLTRTKILVGEQVETCLAQLRDPKEEFNHLHLVDETDITFLVEMCILRKATDLTRFKISGHLPLLGVNFSNTKYRMIMQIPKLVEASGLLSDSRQAPECEVVHDGKDLAGERSPPDESPAKADIMALRLWKQTEHEITLDTDSEPSIDDDLDDEDMSVAETAATDISSQPQSSAAGPTSGLKSQKEGRRSMDEKIFELNFKVDKVSAKLLEARVATTGDKMPIEQHLCDLDLCHLSLDYCLRPHDMIVDVSLKSLDVTDRMSHGNEFKYVVTSDRKVLQSSTSHESIAAKDLVRVNYVRVDRTSPEYHTKYNGIDQTANVTLSTLNFIITRSSILTLYNFILNTFVEDEANSSEAPLKYQRRLSQYTAAQRRQSAQQPNSIQVKLFLDSVNFILNNDGVRLATGELSHGDMSALVANGITKVAARFANFSLTNDLSFHDADGDSGNKQLLTIQGDELIDLRYESFIDDGSSNYPGYDQSLFLRMGSAQFVFLERPVRLILDYLSKFAAMKTIYDRARQAALESAQQMQQTAAKLHFDVVIKTPVVLFPEMHQHPRDIVVAHLGEIWASNTFNKEPYDCINTIKAGLRAINLTSKYHFNDAATDKLQVQTLPIVDDIDFNFDIFIPETSTTRPGVDIKGKIEDVSMRLTERQYLYLMDAIHMVSRTFAGPDEADNTGQDAALKSENAGSRHQNQLAQTKSDVSETDESGKDTLPRVRFAVEARTIGLEVYLGGDIEAPLSLSRIALNNTQMIVHMLKDDSMTVTMQVRSLTVDDTRPNIKSKFKEIAPAIDQGHQFEMQLDMSRPEPQRHGIALITINNPKVILSLDHAFQISNFFLLPFNKAPAQPQPTRRNSSPDQSRDGMEISYRLNVVDAEFILLANPDMEDTEAVVLSAKEVMISQQAVTALAIKQMGMFLCRMDTRSTSTLRFIQTFDVSLSMNNDTRTESGGGQTELVVDVDALVLRLSYRDAMLITNIFNRAFELYNTSTGSKKQFSGTEYAQTLLAHGALRTNEAVAHESLRASFQGLQIILIEEIHEMPMVDMTLKPFNIDVANWSESLSADVLFSVFVNYFNIKNSHWEPLVEPWNFSVGVTRSNTQALEVKLQSKSPLNVNVTHTFLESALATIQMLDKHEEMLYNGERGANAPYKLRNQSGYRLHVWNTGSSGQSNSDVVIHDLDDGDEIPWWFEDWRKRRETTTTSNNMLNVQLEGALWESLRNVSVDIEGEHMYELRPAIQNIDHKVIFHVQLVDNVKVVTIRSALVIENRTLLPVDVAILDAEGNPDGQIRKIPPGEDFPIPIEKAYHNMFCVRPDAGFGYKWAHQSLHWKDFTRSTKQPNTIKCYSDDSEMMPPFIFQVHARLHKKRKLLGNYPAMTIRLSAPVEIENLLPYNINFRIIDKTAGQDYSSFLRSGGTTPLHVVENGHFLLLSIEVSDTNYARSEFAIISTRGTEDLDIDDTIQLLDENKIPLSLKINTIDIPDSGNARKFSIYSPIVIINKTDYPISLKAKPVFGMWSGSQTASVCKPLKQSKPFMYSYAKNDNRNRTLVQASDSDWSQPLSFEAVGSVYDVAMPTQSRSKVHLGVSIQEEQGKLTKIVTFTPRFILNNQMDESIRYRETETRADSVLEPKQSISLYHLRNTVDQQLSIKLPGINNAWSAPFNIQDIGKMYVRLDSADGHTTVLMRVTTVLQDAIVYIVLAKESDDGWPYLLVNQTNEDMMFYQEDPILLRDDQRDTPTRSQKTRRYKLPAHKRVRYSWDMPAIKDKKLVLRVNGRERSVNPQEIGSQLPFRHTTMDGHSMITAIDVKTRGNCQIVNLTPYSQVDSWFKPLPSPSSSTRSVSSTLSHESNRSFGGPSMVREGFEPVTVQPVVNFVFQLNLSQIGVSLINKHLQEIAYVTLRDLNVKFKDSNMYQSLRWMIKWVQIDNQLYGGMFPILLYPTNMTKEGNQEMIPTFQLALDRVKDDSHGVLYIKYFSVLLQEMSVEMDEEFIYAILDFSHLDVPGWNTPLADAKNWTYSADIPEVKLQEDTAQLYFEMLSIQPIRFDLSFLRTDQVNIVDESRYGSSALMFFVNILTMAIGNINAAPMRFNALAMENLRASGPDLANRIFIHYSDQFLYQIHRMLGSADFLGNPVGLFNNLSSGVAELFYEPWQGLIMSDRPQDLGMGIARGFSGFVRKSVFGVTDSFTKFTGSISKGLSAATMDREYQDRRRMNMARNRPRHALGGVTQGANNFANSLASGVAGLVTRPIEGVTKEGVGGFFTGFGKGIVGAVTKPVVGVFDLASNVTEGIRNTTTPTDTNDIERIRYPRYIAQDGILRLYSAHDAQGLHWLKDVEGGKYFQDDYIAHCQVQNNERVAMLTSNRLMLLRTRRLVVEWQEPFTEIQTIKCEPTGIAIYLRSMSWEPFLMISDKRHRETFFKKIEEAVTKYNKFK